MAEELALALKQVIYVWLIMSSSIYDKLKWRLGLL